MLRGLASRSLPLALVLTFGCGGEPPDREMREAQTAIDQARAADAERYAPEEFAAAVAALKQAEEAVRQRDYRRALDQALDSRERAQDSAKQSADQQALLRAQAEQALNDARALLDQTFARLADAQTSRVPRRTIAGLHATIANANAAVQEAGEAIAAGKYQEVERQLSDAAGQLRGVIAELDAAAPARAGKTRR
jgi:hypothetical protein